MEGRDMKAKVKGVKIGKFGQSKTPAQQALRQAEKLRDAGATWTEAHNRLFGPSGEISKLFKTEAERAAFLKTPEAEGVHTILDALPREKPEPSGRILVRVPKSVHASLLAEAEQEGTSLNQLILSKLCIGLKAASR
jgi:predicted HicB family RNase H-like nuclease